MELWIYANIIKILLASITFIGVVITGYHVFKIVGFKNPLILSLMVFLSLTMLNSIIMTSIDISDHERKGDSWVVKYHFFDHSRPALFSTTLIINMKLWLNHLLKIEEQV